MDAVDRLHLSLDSRLTPESTAALILEAIGGRLLPIQRTLLRRAADSPAAMYSSMSDDFARPDPLTHKVRTMLTLLGTAGRVDEARVMELAADPWQLVGQLAIAGKFNGWDHQGDFQSRRNREQRGARTMGLDVGKRLYNRRVRHSIRTYKAAKRMGRQILIRQLLLVSRAGLAPTITAAEMHADPDAAAFVAYWTAMRKRRRQFTLDGVANPMDTIAEMLLTRCEIRAGTDWSMIARAYPRPNVIARLTEQQRGEMIGAWSAHMGVAAGLLKELHAAWPTREIPPAIGDEMWADRPGLMPSREARGAKTVPAVDLATMVVSRGVDSSTWNTVASAYNAARDGWIASLAASDALGLLDVSCPGKAMRLMAGDLQRYHQATSGSAAHPQTAVWAQLPMPWEVLSGEQECTAEMVDEACSWCGVDAQATGWIGPRQIGDQVVEFEPTPELVHGIIVRDPLWAGLLAKAGLWSGKKLAADAGELYAAYRDDEVRA